MYFAKSSKLLSFYTMVISAARSKKKKDGVKPGEKKVTALPSKIESKKADADAAATAPEITEYVFDNGNFCTHG